MGQPLTQLDNIWNFSKSFPRRVVSRDIWHARLPDLTPLDFSIFELFKNKEIMGQFIQGDPIFFLNDLATLFLIRFQ
jgi:hypothetical protein